MAFDFKKPTVQMLGRWQPWHEGHTALFKKALAQTGQVVVMVRDVNGADAGMGNKTGSDNVVVGTDAGEGVWNNANYTNSVILGGEAGATLTSNNSNVIVIGYDAEPSSASVTNEITLD